MNSEKLRSNILDVGSKFVVTDSTTDSVYGPGTTGFICFVEGRDIDFRNIVYFRAVITRRGKGGKDRIEYGNISTPIFDINHDNMKKIMPGDDRRFFVHIEPATVPTNIRDLDQLDYSAWVVANCCFLKRLDTRSKHVRVWPQSKKSTLNSIESCRGDLSEIISRVDSTNRVSMIEDLRKMLASLTKCNVSYLSKIAAMDVAALRAVSKVSSGDGISVAMKEYQDRLKNLTNAKERLSKTKKA